MLRAVIFALDETLLPEAGAIRGAMAATCGPAEDRLEIPRGTLAEVLEAVASARYQSLDTRGFASRFGVTWEECLWGSFGPASQKQLPGLGALAETLRHLAWNDALQAVGRRSPLAPLELDQRYAAERRMRLRPFPEAPALLSALRDRALGLACVTNGASELQREKLMASGLAAHFDELLISGEEGIGKPDPALLLRACDRLGVEPWEAIYVGSSRTRDIAAARAARMRSVLVERFEPDEPGPQVEPDRVIYEVDGLLGFIDGWRAGRAVRLFDPAGTPAAVDDPELDAGRWTTRVGPERDELRPGIRGGSAQLAIEAGLRALRARAAGEPWRYELGEPVDWDALLR